MRSWEAYRPFFTSPACCDVIPLTMVVGTWKCICFSRSQGEVSICFSKSQGERHMVSQQEQQTPQILYSDYMCGHMCGHATKACAPQSLSRQDNCLKPESQSKPFCLQQHLATFRNIKLKAFTALSSPECPGLSL